MRFVAHGAKALLLGPPGVALGLEAVPARASRVFTSATALITTPGEAFYEEPA